MDSFEKARIIVALGESGETAREAREVAGELLDFEPLWVLLEVRMAEAMLKVNRSEDREALAQEWAGIARIKAMLRTLQLTGRPGQP